MESPGTQNHVSASLVTPFSDSDYLGDALDKKLGY